MNVRSRHAALALLLVATLAATVFAPQEEGPDEPVQAVERRQGAVTSSVDTIRIDAPAAHEVLKSREFRDAVPPIFQVTTWNSPAPVVRRIEQAPAPPPEPPQPPPAPFRIVGRYVEDGITGMFVQLNDRTLVARVGDIINDLYQVESITEQTMTVLYLPLNETQTISVGGGR